MNVNTVVFNKAVNYGFGQCNNKCSPKLGSINFQYVCMHAFNVIVTNYQNTELNYDV